jgi:hypothetical protein
MAVLLLDYYYYTTFFRSVCEIYQGFLKRCTKERQHFEIKEENENISKIKTNNSKQHIMEKSQKAYSCTS